MRIPKYSRHSSGQARVRLGGRTFYLGAYDSDNSRAEYRRLVAEYVANNGAVIKDDAKADLRLVEMFAAYASWAKGHYGQDSTEFDKVKRIIRRTVVDYGKTPASSFGYQQFEVIRTGMVSDGLARKTVNENTDRLVRIFKWAASRGLVSPLIPQSLGMIERLKKGRTEAPDYDDVQPVAIEIVEQTLPHLTDVVADMVRLQMVLGCRPGELCGIKPNMVDRSGDVWEVTLMEHKTVHHGKTRTLFVGPRGQEILTKYLLRPEEQHCFRPIDSERQRRAALTAARTTPVKYGNRPGTNKQRKPARELREAYDKDSYRRAIHRACDKAFPAPEPIGRRQGESDRARMSRLTPEQREQLQAWQSEHRWNPNQIRHTFGTVVRKVEGLETARVLLGHSDASVTTIYAEADRQKAIDAARRVG